MHLLKSTLLIISCVFSLVLFAQTTTTINYYNWNPSNPPCNIFGQATTVDGFSHRTVVGIPYYHGYREVRLGASYNTGSGGIRGTEYEIAYNFKKGYSYKITVHAINTSSLSSGYANLRLDLVNSQTQGNAVCTGGLDYVDQTIGGNRIYRSLFAIDYNNISSQHVFNYTTLQASQGYLLVAAIPSGFNNDDQEIAIRSITIEETLTQQFTLSPSTVDVTCGSTSNHTFTVTPSDISGVTAYEWNLGASNTGWQYNGSQAPQTITITGAANNTLSLTTSSCGNYPSISVIVKANGSNYQTLTRTITVNRPFLDISGPIGFCTTGQYSVNNLPCNASISWSASPSNVVSLSGTNPVTVTKLIEGSFTLTATLSMCGNLYFISKPLFAGNAPVTLSVNQIECDEAQFIVSGTAATSFNWSRNYGDLLFGGTSTTASTSIPEVAAIGTEGSISVSTTNNCGSTVNLTKVYQPFYQRNLLIGGTTPPLMPWDQLSVSIDPYEAVPFVNNYKWYVNGNLVKQGEYALDYCTCYNEGPDQRICDNNIVTLEGETDCGTFLLGYLEFEQLCYGARVNLEAYPNPIKDLVTIKLRDIKGNGKTVVNEIKELKVLDKLGQIKKTYKFGKGQKEVQINISDLPSDIYIIEVNDGTNRATIQVIKVK